MVWLIGGGIAIALVLAGMWLMTRKKDQGPTSDYNYGNRPTTGIPKPPETPAPDEEPETCPECHHKRPHHAHACSRSATFGEKGQGPQKEKHRR